MTKKVSPGPHRSQHFSCLARLAKLQVNLWQAERLFILAKKNKINEMSSLINKLPNSLTLKVNKPIVTAQLNLNSAQLELEWLHYYSLYPPQRERERFITSKLWNYLIPFLQMMIILHLVEKRSGGKSRMKHHSSWFPRIMVCNPVLLLNFELC